MKMTNEHYKKLERKILSLLEEKGLNLEELKHEYELAGLSPKRFRWDLVRAAKATRLIIDEFYPYLIDDHIDTALRKITNTRR